MEASALSHPSRIPGLRGPSALLRLQSDERLVALTRRGQHAAFEVLCARYQSRLLSFCRHMLASREDAEDVLQEVFAAAFNAVLADEREINVRPWLYRIARNRSLNHLRRASAVGVDSMDVHYAEHGISTGDKVMRRESFRELIDDVHQLPESQRTALLLREIDAMSYDQIAHAMETTIPAVKSLLVRARISLAEAAEARNLSCDEVRLELGTVAEGLAKLSTPARRHVRSCERCASFKKQLKVNNHALALILPVAPLLIVKKLLFAKLGSTASAGGAHVAGGAGATVGATAAAGAATTGGGGMAGGLVTAGAGALATKAVAGLAAAAIVTAGAVAADNAVAVHHHRHAPVAAAVSTGAVGSQAPVVVRQSSQPVTLSTTAARLASRHSRATSKSPKPPKSASPSTTAAATTTAATNTTAVPAPNTPANPQATTEVTEVTTATTTLPTTATETPSTATATPTTAAATPTSTTSPAPTSVPTPAPAPTTVETAPVSLPETETPSSETQGDAGTPATPGSGGVPAPATPTGGGGVPAAATSTTPDTGGVQAPVEAGSDSSLAQSASAPVRGLRRARRLGRRGSLR
ncbi:MAG: sigma-70 family RNA polymerase sigma factor [Solirubrobacteraceae bacterium]